MDTISGYTTIECLRTDDKRRVYLVKADDTQSVFVAKVYPDFRQMHHERRMYSRLRECPGIPYLFGVCETASHHMALLLTSHGKTDLWEQYGGGIKMEVKVRGERRGGEMREEGGKDHFTSKKD